MESGTRLSFKVDVPCVHKTRGQNSLIPYNFLFGDARHQRVALALPLTLMEQRKGPLELYTSFNFCFNFQKLKTDDNVKYKLRIYLLFKVTRNFNS